MDSSADSGNSIAVDSSGNSYVTGNFGLWFDPVPESATFGPGEANQTILTSAGEFEIFVAKYDTNGLLLWAKRAGGTSRDGADDIALDGLGNSYVTGFFRGSPTFGPGETNETTLVAGSLTGFLAKFAGGSVANADFAGDGISDIGVYRDGVWYLDLNGNDQWDGCGVDGCYVFGSAGDQAVVGDWTGSGQVRIGIFRNGGWYLDLNGNNQWDGCGVDGCYGFGLAGDMPAN